MCSAYSWRLLADETLEEAKTEFIEAKTLRFCEHRLQHLLYLTVDQRTARVHGNFS